MWEIEAKSTFANASIATTARTADEGRLSGEDSKRDTDAYRSPAVELHILCIHKRCTERQPKGKQDLPRASRKVSASSTLKHIGGFITSTLLLGPSMEVRMFASSFSDEHI